MYNGYAITKKEVVSILKQPRYSVWPQKTCTGEKDVKSKVQAMQEMGVTIVQWQKNLIMTIQVNLVLSPSET